MINNTTVSEIASLLLKSDNILIGCHIRPDEDTVGSALALREALYDKNVRIACADEISARSKRVYGNPDVSVGMPQDFNPDFIVFVDTSTLERGGNFSEALKEKINLKIDHHADGEDYAGLNYVEQTRSACGEIIFEIIKAMGRMTKKVAEYCYGAISADSGGFKYSNVSPATHKIAAEILEMGVDGGAINHLLFECTTKKEITATLMTYQALRYYYDDKICLICFSNKMKEESGLTDDDLGAIVSIPKRIEGVELAIAVKQNTDDARKFRVSMRSTKNLPASRFCQLFGGGGHECAAGAVIEADGPEEAVSLLMEKIFEDIEKNG